MTIWGWSKPAKLQARHALRRKIRRYQGGLCPYCGVPFGHASKGPEKATVEHVIPLARGGPDAAGNLLVTHDLCNNRKGQRPPYGCELLWLYIVNVKLGIAT